MSINLSVGMDGKIKITTGPLKTRKEDLTKWLGRNNDAILVKLIGHPEPTAPCSVGHLCRIEEGDEENVYNVFIGRHLIGQLPDDAIAFAESVDSSPDCLIAIVGKIEDDDVFIYIAE